jgi:hypothetical protein
MKKQMEIELANFFENAGGVKSDLSGGRHTRKIGPHPRLVNNYFEVFDEK